MRGGMTELRKIATVAETWGMTMAPHLFPELNVHLLASIPNGIWAEQMGLLDDVWVDPPAGGGRLHHGARAAGPRPRLQGGRPEGGEARLRKRRKLLRVFPEWARDGCLCEGSESEIPKIRLASVFQSCD